MNSYIMNYKTFYSIFLMALSIAFIACAQDSEKNRAYFHINPLDRKIVMPVQIDDSITADLTFDTGAYGFYLDSSFIATQPSLKLKYNKSNGPVYPGSIAWSYESTAQYQYPLLNNLKIGTAKVDFDSVGVLDYKKLLLSLNGLFNLPEKDRTNIWELNFEHNYLEIHPASSFKLPADCYTFPMYHDRPNMIQFPMHVKCSDGDTLTINKPFIIDSAMPWDVALIAPAKETSFFNKKKDVVWLPYQTWYYKRHTVTATVFNNFEIDSLRIYTFPQPPFGPYLIGINFLKRFNVFFDLKNRIVGLQPIKDFQRIVKPNVTRFHYSEETKANGKVIVNLVADYDKNYFKTAGLKAGDEIVSINGISYKNITRKQWDEFSKDTLLYKVIRNKKTITLAIHIDKTEDQSD